MSVSPPTQPADLDLLFSVVVCTYNRADLLVDALETLSQQDFDPSLYEIIVVDNNSQDHTRQVTAEFSQRHPQICYCFEPNQGISHARNRGWQEARGKYVAYIDDECRVPPQWLAIAQEVIDQVAPGVFGGPYFACYPSAKPAWFKDEYGSHSKGQTARLLNSNEYLSEANLFCERPLLKAAGGFDPNFGHRGKALGYGEGAALLQTIRANLPEQKIYYEPRLYLYHAVRGEKMNLTWSMREHFMTGRDSFRVFQPTPMPVSLAQILRLGILPLILVSLISLDFLRSALWRDRRQYPYWQNYCYERSLKHLSRLGHLYAQWRAIERQIRMLA